MDTHYDSRIGAVRALVRKETLFPPKDVADAMVELIMNLYGPRRHQISEGHIDEIDVMQQEPQPPSEEPEEKEEEEPEEDEVLGENGINGAVLESSEIKRKIPTREVDPEDKEMDILDE